MELKWKLHQKTMIFNTTDGAYSVMEVRRGTYIRYVAYRISEEFNNMNYIKLGDDTTADGFGALTLTTGFSNLTGAYLTTQHSASNQNGMLYTQALIDSLSHPAIKATYAKSGTPSTGVMTIYIVYTEIE